MLSLVERLWCWWLPRAWWVITRVTWNERDDDAEIWCLFTFKMIRHVTSDEDGVVYVTRLFKMMLMAMKILASCHAIAKASDDADELLAIATRYMIRLMNHSASAHSVITLSLRWVHSLRAHMATIITRKMLIRYFAMILRWCWLRGWYALEMNHAFYAKIMSYAMMLMRCEMSAMLIMSILIDRHWGWWCYAARRYVY